MANSTTIGPFQASDLTGCPHRIHLEHSPTNTTTARAADTSPTLTHRRATRLAYRDQIVGLLPPHTDLTGITDSTERHQATLDAVTAKTPLIVGAALGTAANRTANIDLLVHSTDGYVPVTIEQHSTIEAPGKRNPTTIAYTRLNDLPGPSSTRPGRFKSNTRKDWDRLLHARAILSQLGWLASAPLMGVIGRENFVVWKTVTDQDARRHDEQYETARAIAIAAATGDQKTNPVLCTNCATCPWETHCRTELETDQHPSLLPGVGPALAATFASLGADTIPQIAALDPDRQLPKEARAIVQARSHIADKPLLFNGNEPLTVPVYDVEIDVDLEDNGTIPYLWGMLVTDRAAGTTEYRPFVTWDGSETGAQDVLAELLAELDRVREHTVRAGRSVGCFHYSRHERTWASKIGGTDANNRTNWWTDLNHTISPAAFPATGRGLKDLAGLAGYAWNETAADGELSILWHDQATDPNNPNADTVKDQILTYNEDDCRAGLALRSWLATLNLAGDS